MPPPSPDEPVASEGTRKPRRAEGWLIVVGALILVALLGHVLNQQRSSKLTTDPGDAASTARDSASSPTNDPQPSDVTPRNDTDTRKPSASPMRAVYMVTHKHRLRDCRGTLTFTRNRLRFDSDEPEDSFEVGRDEVTLDGDEVRIRSKPWRFEFNDGTRMERLYIAWKAGILQPTAPAP
jgi:hypothetical protein